ncbi:MAG: LacI family DNA-binding transcriptional regulator [Peptostreptococcus porci]|uniref:LacI family DNA-binding transcriptional regulator n=1 Tax=Peptostreptococcus porci TaxID=2652282 RepID=UPI002A74D54B|nr:LacI family DNA-binding transcriptional regulator [Peptostreptococcus porci]MDY2794351.1 LacI family DNA-binding transcriptional regulator [Peptostreptococcus porci]MDY4560695.1 LacI family DNA-binding transcriptional regulator [Peptostreptococcus porci]MDY5478992.1 LacI family DNA-binding transcriptional regulator [Peptostreptococcus porci]
MKEGRHVTIKMVADKAGVSKSTVSRAIGNYPDISDKTKEKIFSVMKELNYYPSAIARSLANRISKNVGLVLPADDDFFLNPFFQESLRIISKTASSRGYDVLIAYNGDNETRSVERLVKANKVDGVIMMRSVVQDPTIEYLRDSNFPFVLIGKSIDYSSVHSVDTDNVDACKTLTKKLIDSGCKKIAFIGGDKNSVVTIDRFNGYVKMIEENGMKLNKDLIQENEFSSMNGYRSIEKILKNDSSIDGIVITDALIFSGVMDYINNHKSYETGESSIKIKVIGTFGTGNFQQNPDIEIINVDVDSKILGEKSCNTLIDILEGKDVEMTQIVDYKISNIN